MHMVVHAELAVLVTPLDGSGEPFVPVICSRIDHVFSEPPLPVCRTVVLEAFCCTETCAQPCCQGPDPRICRFRQRLSQTVI